jgi:hypothetical protein
MTDAPKPLHPNVQLAVQATSSVVTAIAGSWVGSHDGNGGTLRGMVIGAASGALISGLATRWLEHTARHVKVPARLQGRLNRRYVALGTAAGIAGFTVCLGGVSAVEASVFGGRSLSAEVTHSHATGTTLGTVLDNTPATSSPSILAPSTTVPSPSPSMSVIAPVPTGSAVVVTPAPSLSPSPSPLGVSGAPSPPVSQQQGATP